MRYGVYVQNFGEYGDPHNLIALALDAEQAGWDGFFLWDHLLLYRHSDIPFVDAWIALAAIASHTKRMLLGPMITPLARRRQFMPRAIQSPRVPVWVTGFWPNKPPMRRAARWDGVFPLKAPPIPLAGLAPGAAPWSILWPNPQEFGDASNASDSTAAATVHST